MQNPDSNKPEAASNRVPEAYLDSPASTHTHSVLLRPGTALFSRLRFAHKLLVITGVLILPLVSLLVIDFFSETEQSLMARKNAMRQQVEVASGLLEWAYGKQLSGELREAQAKKTASEAVAALRDGQNTYLWISTLAPRVIMHPTRPDLVNADVGHIEDPNGVRVFQAFADTISEKGKGYVSYQWKKSETGLSVDRLSYVSGFEPWGWIIGTGAYMDDIQPETQKSMAKRFIYVGADRGFGKYRTLRNFVRKSGSASRMQKHVLKVALRA